MARLNFAPRRTIAYLYGWTLILAGVALALRFVPYSDNHGHFDAFWTTFMALCLAGALAASIYVIHVLEILKLRRVRWRQLVRLRGPADRPDEAEVDAAVQHELDTGTFQAVDPATGEMTAIDPDTGEMDAVPAQPDVTASPPPEPPARAPGRRDS
jgi:UDP-GlcNAc:undecaprenyl-phosphate GlcNAc-1-phosphate transferase